MTNTLTSRVSAFVESRSVPLTFDPTRTERHLWLLVGVALLGDVLTTLYGLSIGLSEGNPLATRLIDAHGVVTAMVVLKGCAILVALTARRVMPERHAWTVPASLALPWTAAACINAVMIGVTVV